MGFRIVFLECRLSHCREATYDPLRSGQFTLPAKVKKGWCSGDQRINVQRSHAVDPCSLVKCQISNFKSGSVDPRDQVIGFVLNAYGPLKPYTNSPRHNLYLQSMGSAGHFAVHPRGAIHPEFSSEWSPVQLNSHCVPSGHVTILILKPRISDCLHHVPTPAIDNSIMQCEPCSCRSAYQSQAVERGGFGWMVR